jgi:hypothetical protein
VLSIIAYFFLLSKYFHFFIYTRFIIAKDVRLDRRKIKELPQLELGGLILIEEIMTHNGDFSASGG